MIEIIEQVAPLTVLAAEDRVLDLPDHLTRLAPEGLWAAWRCVCLRGAGFPASEVLRLSSADCAAAADSLIDAGENLETARRSLLSVLDSELAKAPANEYESLRRETRAIKQRLKQNKLPDKLTSAAFAPEEIESWRRAHWNEALAQANFDQTYENEVERIGGTICEIASSERFREAVVWQSRHAFHTGLESLLKPTDGGYKRNTRRRQHEELVASYLQRYCTKNDTVGFFGPVGWARLVDEGPGIVAQPGPDLILTRTVYFESWCIDALIDDIINSDRTILRWARPRFSPVCHLEAQTLHIPLQQPLPLSTAQQALIRACDGESTAEEIAGRMVNEYGYELPSDKAVYRVLEYLRTKEVIYWTFEVPFTAHPERTLKRLLDGVGDLELRESALGKLAKLDQARAAVANAGGDAAKLDEAMGNLQVTFTGVTGQTSSRAAGKMYAGRTLVYEDCQRDITVELGPEMIAALGPPLRLLLDSARWLTHEVAIHSRRMVKEIYDDLARQTNDGRVDGITFWLRVQRELLTAESSPIAALQLSFQDRWAAVLELPPNERQVERSTEMLKERVGEIFNAPAPGWHAARYHSPDVMVLASSAEAIRQGDYELIMGEMHVGINTLGLSLFLEQHPAKQELMRAAGLDIPEPRIIVSPPRFGGMSGRNHVALVLGKDFRLEFAANSDKVEVGRRLPVGNLVVEERAGELVVKTRDGNHEFEIVEVLADVLTGQVLNGFKLLRPARHLPRVKIGRLIVSRESWVFPASEMAFAYEKSGATRFANARSWARAAHLPRFVFMKSPVEVKPVYVDLDSPIYVDLFAKIIRRTRDSNSGDEKIAISEMLPRTDQTWLPDKEGQRYTSEFRIVAVDLAGG